MSPISFVSLDQILKIKIFHIVVSEHPELIEGRRRFIAMNVPDPEESAEYGSIDYDGADSDEEYESGSREAGGSTGVAEVGTKEVENVQKYVNFFLFLTIC